MTAAPQGLPGYLRDRPVLATGYVPPPAIQLAPAQAVGTTITTYPPPAAIGTSGITYREVEVTPELAREWLGRNSHNRALRPASVEKYARDMRNGNWQLTGEAIKRDPAGELLDGQNRLHAVIKAGRPVRMLVADGVPTGAQDVMDSGVARSNTDTLTLNAVPNAGIVAGVVNIFTAYRRGFYIHAHMDNSAPVVSHTDALAFVQARPDVVVAASRAKQAHRNLALPISHMTVAMLVLNDVDTAECTAFFDLIIEGDLHGKGDPLATLCLQVANERARRKRLPVARSLYYIFRTWNAWRTGEQLSQIRTSSAAGPYAIPVPR